MDPNPNPSEKRPIDRIRDSGMSFEVGTTDEGAVGSMVVIADSLFVIKPNAICAIKTADQIDPERTNIALPKAITRQVLAVGSDSELVGKIMLTGVSLLDKGKFTRAGIDFNRGLSLCLDALTTVITMTNMAAEFEAAQEAVWAKAEARRQSGQPEQPFVGGVEPRCKSFMQQAHHAVGDILAIVRLFYPEVKNAPWDALYKKVRDELGEEDAFIKFLEKTVPFFKLVLNTRDFLEHKNPKGGTVKDFAIYQLAALLTDGTPSLAKSYNSLPPRDSRYITGLHRASYLASVA
jgi:hypothetical protein